VVSEHFYRKHQPKNLKTLCTRTENQRNKQKRKKPEKGFSPGRTVILVPDNADQIVDAAVALNQWFRRETGRKAADKPPVLHSIKIGRSANKESSASPRKPRKNVMLNKDHRRKSMGSHTGKDRGLPGGPKLSAGEKKTATKGRYCGNPSAGQDDSQFVRWLFPARLSCWGESNGEGRGGSWARPRARTGSPTTAERRRELVR